MSQIKEIPRLPIDDETDEEIQSQQVEPVEKRFTRTRFVSSVSGTKNKDVIPILGVKRAVSSYDTLRSPNFRSEVDEENIRKYGTKYPEFLPAEKKRNSESDEVMATMESVEQRKSAIYRPLNSPVVEETEEPAVYEMPKEEPTEIFYKKRESDFKTVEIDEDTLVYENEKTAYDITRDNDENEDNQVVMTSMDDIELSYEEESVNTIDELPEYEFKAPEKPVKTHKSFKKLKYSKPPLNLVSFKGFAKEKDLSDARRRREIIEKTLSDFSVPGHVSDVTKGPRFTLFEVKLEPGIRVEKVKTLELSLQANLETNSIRILAPIPGKPTVGIEVSNENPELVLFGDLLKNPEFLKDDNPLNVILGLDVTGSPVYLNIEKMPHGLIAGTTGSGKSVCINSIITSILYKADPNEVKLLLVDPKLTLVLFDEIPHLIAPVITDVKYAAGILKWIVDEMENRFALFRNHRLTDITQFNKYADDNGTVEKIPKLVIIMDEFGDLLINDSGTIEHYIQRITQKARSAGIHLIVSTQRPSADIIKGSIKANLQTRIAFKVATGVDSRVVLDKEGAESLLGNGDMLYNNGTREIRVQGAFLSAQDIQSVCDYAREKAHPDYLLTEEELKQEYEQETVEELGIKDELFSKIAKFVVNNNMASINTIQKTFSIGFNRAQSIMNALENLHIVSENLGSKPRKVLIKIDELEDILNNI
ncbi:MAG: DNA translocase FtsK [Bacilli bacterium]|nr:DNA translocase FtsK [Bacilli bacterium]